MTDNKVENENENEKVIFDRKEYNKNYYANNKQKILDYYKEKIQCPICSKMLAKSNFLRHMQKPICKRTAEFNKLFEQNK